MTDVSEVGSFAMCYSGFAKQQALIGQNGQMWVSRPSSRAGLNLSSSVYARHIDCETGRRECAKAMRLDT